jgi:methionyl-tRNA formyltransferase
MDTGGIVAQEEIEILPDDVAESVGNMLSVLGADLMLRTLDRLERDGRLEARPQNDALATLAPKIAKEEGRIDWTDDVDRIICRVHALRPWPMAYAFLGGAMVRILEAEPDESFDDSDLPEDKRPPCGAVVACLRNLGPVVKVGDGRLLLSKVQPENKKPMSGGDWINGGGVKTGAVFRPAPSGKSS